MPLINLPPVPPTPEELPRPPIKILDPEYRHSLVDARETPLSAMITHIEGASWVVDYYSQIVSSDEELSPFQPGQIAPYQQYHLVHRYQLKLQGDLSKSFDDETGQLTMTGTALMYPGFIPNRGDAFIADIGDGQAGQFSITSATPKTQFKETVYEVSFEWSRYATQDVVELIDERVVKESYFVQDFLIYGQNPIIASDALMARGQLEAELKKLQYQWFTYFFSNEYRTQLVPGQAGEATYDPFVTKAIMLVHSQLETPYLTRIRQLNVDGVDQANQPSFWDALINIDKNILDIAFKTCTIVERNVFPSFPYFEGFRWSGCRYCVISNEPLASVDRDYQDPYLITGLDFVDLKDAKIELASAIYKNSFEEFHYPGEPTANALSAYFADEVPLTHPIAYHGGYVLSSNFYGGNVAGMSKLEVLVKQFFDTGGEVNRDVLFAMCASSKEWGRLERYYYIPILIVLLKASLRRV